MARRLRDERSRRGLTQAAAGVTIGVAQSTYAGWEAGRATPSSDHLAAVAAFLDIPVEQVRLESSDPLVVDVGGWGPLGQLIGRRREELQLTREALAHLIGVSVPTLGAWELGYRIPRAHQLKKLGDAIHTSVEELEAALPAGNQPSSGRLAGLIHRRRLALGLRLRDVAARADLNTSTLNRWTRGESTPEPASLERLAIALELPATVVLQEVERDRASAVDLVGR